MALDKEDIMALIAILQKGLEDEPTPKKTKARASSKVLVEEEEEEEVQFNSKIKTKGGSRKKSKGKYVNKFDKMSEFQLHKEDNKLQEKLSKLPPVARQREEKAQIEVTCRVCGKKEKISPSLIFDHVSRYKCNNCCTQAG